MQRSQAPLSPAASHHHWHYRSPLRLVRLEVLVGLGVVAHALVVLALVQLLKVLGQLLGALLLGAAQRAAQRLVGVNVGVQGVLGEGQSG